MANIYIIGPMRGVEGYNYPKFNRWAEALRTDGHTVENPAEIGEKYGTPDELDADPVKLEALMAEEIGLMEGGVVDIIFALRGWERSKGARHEMEVALKCGLEILTEAV